MSVQLKAHLSEAAELKSYWGWGYNLYWQSCLSLGCVQLQVFSLIAGRLKWTTFLAQTKLFWMSYFKGHSVHILKMVCRPLLGHQFQWQAYVNGQLMRRGGQRRHSCQSWQNKHIGGLFSFFILGSGWQVMTHWQESQALNDEVIGTHTAMIQ